MGLKSYKKIVLRKMHGVIQIQFVLLVKEKRVEMLQGFPKRMLRQSIF